jgi:lipocalin
MNLEQIDTSTTAGKLLVMSAWDNKRPVAFQRYKEGSYVVLTHDQEPAWDWSENNYAVVAEPVGPEEVWVLQRHGDPICVYPEEKDGTIRYIRADLAGEKG